MADITKILLKWRVMRRFGVELEFNTRNDQSRESFKRLIERVPGQRAEVRNWERTNDNTVWVCKTDSSCGLEINTPVMCGPVELKNLGLVVAEFQRAGSAFDTKCGLHVHVDVSDMTMEQIHVLIKYWAKIEHVVMNAHPEHRRKNGYCRPINEMFSDWRENRYYTGDQIFRAIRQNRGALNVQHLDTRRTIEFRMGDMCTDPEDIKNRVRFLVWFVEIAKNTPAPRNLNWFTPKQTMRFLGLLDVKVEGVEKQLSRAMESMRDWILRRLEANMPGGSEHAPDRKAVRDMLTESGGVARKAGSSR